jgi:hypothetical protein
MELAETRERAAYQAWHDAQTYFTGLLAKFAEKGSPSFALLEMYERNLLRLREERDRTRTELQRERAIAAGASVPRADPTPWDAMGERVGLQHRMLEANQQMLRNAFGPNTWM